MIKYYGLVLTHIIEKYTINNAVLVDGGDFSMGSLFQTIYTTDAPELRALGAERVGCYVAHHRYVEYCFDTLRSLFDFVWIPNYFAKPSWPCDLWQYTDAGSVGGINSNVDLNRITGEGHDLSWFMGG